MRNKLYLECTSGISGDMTVAALLDLGADQKKLVRTLKSLPVKGFDIKISRVMKSGIDACDFDVLLDHDHENHDHDMKYLYGHDGDSHSQDHEEHHYQHSHEALEAHGHPHSHEHHVQETHGNSHTYTETMHSHHGHHHHEHRGLNDIMEIIDHADMTDRAKSYGKRIFKILAEAEAKAHNVPVDQVHFHEVGAVDSIVDILSVAICMDDLDVEEVIEKGKTIPGFHIKQGERILESSYSENMDDMVNRVYVYNSSNKKIGILTNTRWANMYGIFQSAITVDSGNGKQEAMNELKGISKNASLTSTGDYRCVSGLGVIIEDSRTGLKGRFWIESDSHEWKNGSYTMKLDLEFKNIMDTQEEDEEQTSSSLSDLSESSALEDVLNQARSWIGIGENPPGSNHNEITVLYGMDAAWCCMFIWACFNKSGHADLFMGGAKEAYCFNVRDYYQARGKWGSTPKKGALVIYGGQGHIGIVESVNSAGGYTSIEGNYGDDVKRRDSHQNVLGFCYIDYPVTKSAEGSDEVISGTTVAVPGSVAQTGIIKDYTNYSYFFGRWNSGSTQKIIADLWENNGKQGKNGIATINGYYLIALRPVFGSAGDVVSVVLEDGARFNAIIADEKGDDAGNQWGHVYSGAVSIVEFESLGNSETNNGAQLNIGQWAGKKVTAIINGGRYSGL